ncbi:TPA_exp: Uncharacterized protein A8136_6865 [Trichophyton benhamiae CBS 112371]|uniref:Uncharacterized protein n=1 Tax=Arthroderma benhamiae (strain ATCC MYA-4681 / CBS 112371) TaxID=663331 RepID=D4AS63_ARTBC|nr:uncharacterized protein ARB_07078 [Trichophyton benhamiae CBS 112371]EFE34127.1 hypothetical protein ARB_07078 [Trichophyton benhamiae CBS 112371]DAA77099.1 TPA_exp: Uncharacterized protein A8136_6865 [Trichophyton benhamiae CBS 112371]
MDSVCKFISEWISASFPSTEETREAEAFRSALRIEHVIDGFEDDVRDLYPDRTDIITVIKKFRQALYDEHGGVPPSSVLCLPLTIQAQGKMTYDRVVERWSDWTSLSKEFPFLTGFPSIEEQADSIDDSEALAVETALAMQKWHVDKYGNALC